MQLLLTIKIPSYIMEGFHIASGEHCVLPPTVFILAVFLWNMTQYVKQMKTSKFINFSCTLFNFY